MKTRLLSLLLTGFALTGGVAQSAWTPADMMRYKRVSSPVVSDDGRLIAYVVASDRMEGESSDFLSHIHVVSTDGRMNSQFTFGDKSCTNPRFSPDGQYLSFTSGRGKDAKSQLYLLRLSGGEAWPLTAQRRRPDHSGLDIRQSLGGGAGGSRNPDDPKIYADHSAMFNIKNAKTPTLVIHGMADDRVPPEQGLQLQRALQRLGVPTQMVTYPRQPHGFTEPKFVQDVGERVIEWFNRHLGRKQPVSLLTIQKK